MSSNAAAGRRRVLSSAAALLFMHSADTLAAPPTLTGVTPFAGNPGTSFPVKFTGKLEGEARQVWSDDSSLVFTLPDGSGNATVTIAATAKPGIRLIRFVNTEGATLPLRFAVGPLPLVEEKEPNDELTAPQLIPKLPAWIQGKLEKAGDVDGYALSLKKGVPLFLKADGYSLGSPVDLILHVLDSTGAKVATFSDGRNLDPEGVFVPLEDGVYTLQLAGFAHPPAADVNFTGSAACVYQIASALGPVVNRVFPAAVPLLGKGSVELRGVAATVETAAARLEVTAAQLSGTGEVAMLFPKGAIAPIPVVRARHPISTPPIATVEAPASIQVPALVGGSLEKVGAVAAYKVAMKKGERLMARFWSRSLGLGIEGDLAVQGPTAQQVAANASPSDITTEPNVTWTAAVDGDYTLLVRDLFQHGGIGCEFVVEIAAPAPAFTVELTEGKPVRMDAGKTLALKLKSTFTNNWKEPLMVRVSGLPEGVFAPEVAVPEKGGDFEVTLHSASNAPSATAQASLSIWTKATPPVFVGMAYSLRADLKRGDSASDIARDLWVTVGPPPATPPPAPKK